MKRLALCIWILAGSASAGSYSIHKYLGRTYDTVISKATYCDGSTVVTRDSMIYAGVSLVDTAFSFGDDTIFHPTLVYKNNGGNWQSYSEQYLHSTELSLCYGMQADIGIASIDSLIIHQYENGLLAGSIKNDGPSPHQSHILTAQRDTLYKIEWDWYSGGRPIPVTQTWALQWDSSGSSQASSNQGKVCAVTVRMLNSDRTPAVGVWVTAYLIRSNVKDSAGYGYTNTPVYKQTNSQGVAVFNCVWSSYLIPLTDWRFTAHTSSIGGVRRTVTIPRTTSYLLDLN